MIHTIITMITYLGFFNNIDNASTRILKLFTDITVSSKDYIVFQESHNKVHYHFCVKTALKKNTIQKYIREQFPELVRTTRGGEHQYTLKETDKYQTPEEYPELPYDYITKEGHHQSGEMWDEEEYMKRFQRYHKWKDSLPAKKQSNNIKKKVEKSKSEKLDEHLKSLLQTDIRYFVPGESPHIDQEKLIAEIINFYRINGKPANRNIFSLIAENVLWYSPQVAPECPNCNYNITEAVKSNIHQILNPYGK